MISALGFGEPLDIVFFAEIVIICLYCLFFKRFAIHKARYKQFTKLYGVTSWLRTTEFTDDEIIITDHTTTMKHSYSTMTDIKEKGNKVLIFLGNDNCIRIYKDAFTEGSWEECKKLIESKKTDS